MAEEPQKGSEGLDFRGVKGSWSVTSPQRQRWDTLNRSGQLPGDWSSWKKTRLRNRSDGLKQSRPNCIRCNLWISCGYLVFLPVNGFITGCAGTVWGKIRSTVVSKKTSNCIRPEKFIGLVSFRILITLIWTTLNGNVYINGSCHCLLDLDQLITKSQNEIFLIIFT